MKNSEKGIRNTLLANAIFSGSSGTMLALFSPSIASMMNIENTSILFIIGLVLIGFMGLLLFTALKSSSPGLIRFIILQDWLWVLGSAVLLIARPFSISLYGNLTILIVALLVMSFAIAQSIQLKKSTLHV